MSIEYLTIEDFMQLDVAALRIGLDCFANAIEACLIRASAEGLTQAERDEHLDRLTSLLTLRKVFKYRLTQLEEKVDSPMGQPEFAMLQASAEG